MKKQKQTFDGVHHRHRDRDNGDDVDEALKEKNDKKKKKKVLNSLEDSETHPHNLQTRSTSTSMPNFRESVSQRTTNRNNLSHPSGNDHDDTHERAPTVEVSSARQARLNEKFKYAFHATVPGKKFGHKYFSTQLLRQFSPEGTLEICELGHGFFSLKFSLPSDYNRVRERVEPWKIAGHSIALLPWVPNFKPSEALIPHVDVWIRLRELPLEYYDDEVILDIVTYIGNLLKVDIVTENQAKGSFARFCCRVYRDHCLPRYVKVGSLRQLIEYEGLLVCDRCRLFGHHWQNCPQRQCHRASDPGIRRHGVQNSEPSPMVSGHRVFEEGESSSAINIETSTLPQATGGASPSPSLMTSTEPEDASAAGSLGMTPSTLQVSTNLASTPASSASPLQSSLETSPTHQEAIPQSSLELETSQVLWAIPQSSLELETSQVHRAVPQSSFETSQTHHAIPRLPSRALSVSAGPSGVPPSSMISHPQHPSPPAPLAITLTTSIDQLPSERQAGNSITTERLHSTTTATSLQLNRPQTQTPQAAFPQVAPISSGIKLYSEGIQRSTKHREINITPVEVTGHSTEGSPKAFSIHPTISRLHLVGSIFPTGNANQHHLYVKPTVIDRAEYSLLNAVLGGSHNVMDTIPDNRLKKLISWNCRGAGDLKFMRALKDLIDRYRPSILLLFETRISGIDACKVIEDIGFSGSCVVDPVGVTGGIWLLWRKEEVQIQVIPSPTPQIHAVVDLRPEHPSIEC